LNVIKDAHGVPCEIEDSSIYAFAREDYPNHDSKEEERRLFYVAMTRARESARVGRIHRRIRLSAKLLLKSMA
jgi:superfamily I DNA/RNA helicase